MPHLILALNAIQSCKSQRSSESGQTLVEYGLIIALVAVGVVGALGGLATALDETLYDYILATLADAT